MKMANSVVYFLGAVLMATCVASNFMTDENCKCKPKPGYFEKEAKPFGDCYKNTTGNDFDVKTFNLTSLNENQQKSIAICMAKQKNIISMDGTKYNATLAVAAMDDLDVDKDTKAQLINGINECAKPESNGFVFLKCTKDVAEKVCKPK